MKICPHCETGYHDSFTTCPTHGVLLSEIRDLRPGMLIRGTYRIVRKLGKGGMGAVYLVQHTLMNEPRALKFLSHELSEDGEFANRFLREVRTLRQLRNRNVVDCGDPERAEDGSLFYPMEFIDGPDLRSFIKIAPKPFDVRLALDITRGIAEGLGAAHAKGVVHRDIKPENILMAREGDKWVPKIADFGIVATKESGQQTRTGNVLLTMAYAAPEQWMGTRAAELDGRTDLYALGGLLYEMLTGHPVFEAENYHEWLQLHLNVAPRPPSALRPDLADWRGLDELVLRLLAKDRKDRPKDVPALLKLLDGIVYDSAATRVTEDADATIVVPPSPRSVWWEAEPSRPISTPRPPGANRAESPEAGLVPTGDRGQDAAPAPGSASDSAPFEGPPSGGYPPIDWSSRVNPRPNSFAPASEQGNKRAKSFRRWASAALLALLIAGGYFYTHHFYVPKVSYSTLQSQTQPILSVAFSSNGETLATASHENTIQLWNMVTGKALNDLPDPVDSLAFSPRGSSLAAADWDGNVTQWDVGTGQILATLSGHNGRVLCVAFSPDGAMLASGGSDKTIRLWDLSAEKTTGILIGNAGNVNSVVFSPDGKTLASGFSDGTIRLWDVATGNVLRTLSGDTGAVNSLAYSSDGKTLASGGGDMTIKLWDAASGALLRTLHGHAGPVRSVAFSPDGTILASGSDDATVKLWHPTGPPAAFTTLQGHTGAVNSVAFNPDGTVLASGSSDDTVRLWNMTTLRN
jgi:WD40 repeat protein/tRNA A-37 threonylcarbamoyl transferase component Bud32